MKPLLRPALMLLGLASLRCATAQTKSEYVESDDDRVVCEDEPTLGSHIRQQSCRSEAAAARRRENDAEQKRLMDQQGSMQMRR